MKKIIQFTALIILFCNNISIVKAQNKSEYLEPVHGIYDFRDYQLEYYLKVRKILFNGLSQSPEIIFQITPSFTPESVLDIEFNNDDNKYYIIYHICEQHIWHNNEWEKIKVNKFKVEIDKESVELIKSLFDIAVSKTRFPKNNNFVRLDGTNYYFSINKFGIKSGLIWSPSKGSKMEKLVNIGYKLIELTVSAESTIIIDDKLKRMIEELIVELQI